MLPNPELCSLQLAEGSGFVVHSGGSTLHMDTLLGPLLFRLGSYQGAVGRVAFSSWDTFSERVTW